jgi:hypothetical protein
MHITSQHAWLVLLLVLLLVQLLLCARYTRHQCTKHVPTCMTAHLQSQLLCSQYCLQPDTTGLGIILLTALLLHRHAHPCNAVTIAVLHAGSVVCLLCALQQDTTGLGIILLTALTEEQWVEEDDFARKLNLPPKMVRKAIRYLEQVRGVSLEQSKEETPNTAYLQRCWH